MGKFTLGFIIIVIGIFTSIIGAKINQIHTVQFGGVISALGILIISITANTHSRHD